MRIAHVIQRYYPYIGGSEEYFKEISERLVKDGHRVTVLTTDAWDIEHFWSKGKRRVAKIEDEINGVVVRRFPVSHLPFGSVSYPVLRRLMSMVSGWPIHATNILLSLCQLTPQVPELRKYLLRTEDSFDIIHATNIPFDSLIYFSMLYARRKGIPLVITPFTHLGESNDERVRKYYTMRHQMYLLRSSSKVVVQTDLEKEYLKSRGLPPSKMRKIGVGVNPEQVTGGDASKFLRKYGLKKPLVFYVGTTAFDKGTVHLVEAMKRLWDSGSSAQLVLAGPTMTHFRRYFDGLPESYKSNAHLLGFIDDKDKRGLLAAGDVFAMPSRTDSFGIVYLEAWLNGKPVIGANAGGVPEVISDGKDGFLVKFGDVSSLANRIKELLENKDLSSRLAKNGKEKVSREMTWDVKYSQVKTLYAELAC